MDRQKALEEAAKTLLVSMEPRLEDAQISVGYFGHGQRFSFRRDPNGKLSLTLYFHETSTANFGEIVEEAAKASSKLFDKNVTISAELLMRVVFSQTTRIPLTKNDTDEILRALGQIR